MTAELDRLRAAAYEALGPLGEGVEIEHASLLRRQVARRCVYGVDLNPIAVELARLAIWIHTFVPGLPLCFLDHNLVCGDSLTGIGTIDEAIQALDPERRPGQPSLFRDEIRRRARSCRVGAATTRARTADASAAEIAEARERPAEAVEAVQPARDLFDLIVAARLGEASRCHCASTRRASPRIADLPHAARLAVERPQRCISRSRSPRYSFASVRGSTASSATRLGRRRQVEELGFWALRFPA